MNNIINELNKIIEHDNLIIKELTEKNIELENRIEKAIELIPIIVFRLDINGITQYLRLTDLDYGKTLLEILKGDSNEK